MAKKRIQEKIVNSRLLFPTILIYGALLMALRWNSQPQMWMQGLSIASTTILMLALNNRYALLRAYSRMVSIAYLVLSMLLLQEPFGLDETLIPVCFAAFFFVLFNAYQDRQQAGTIFYAFCMMGIASIFRPQILYFMPILWFILIVFILAFSFRTFIASLLGLLLPYWLLSGYYCYQGTPFLILSHLTAIIQPQDFFHTVAFNEHQWVTFAALVLLNIIGIIHFLRNSHLDKIKIRMFYGAFMVFQLACVAFIFALPEYVSLGLRLMTIPTAILIAHFLSLTHTWLTNIAFLAITILLFLLTLYNLWIPSSLF